MSYILRLGMTAVILTPCCITDMKSKTLPTVWLLAGTAAGTARAVWERGLLLALMGLLPGCVLFAVSFATRGGIGKGDAYLYLAVGSLLGLWNCLTVLFAALLLASCYGIFLMKVRKKGRKYKIPFAPFTAGGCLLLGILSLLA